MQYASSCRRRLLDTKLLSRQKMSFHFASSEYASCFQNLPKPDVPQIRESAIQYLDSFDKNEWYNDPIASLLKGKALRGGTKIDTVNALGQTNGKQEYATAEQIQALKDHISTYKSPQRDLREPLRKVEQAFLTKYTGELIGNQCLDFQKQDGITEIEEAIMANHVERNLNDLVLREEVAGKITVNRKPIYVSCVSNFTNFLDLFRKTIRSLEVGTPCVILGRSNTVQHSYRWTKLLMDLCIAEGVDPGMVTYLSCPIEDIIDITTSCQDHTGNLYATCSRDLAKAIKGGYPNTVASTGGPNTLIALDWTGPIQEAIRMSAAIESSGQCTALRHAVVPTTTKEADIAAMLGSTKAIQSAAEAVKAGDFDCVFPNHTGSPPVPTGDGLYKRHESVDACYRISNKLPPNDMNEYWRKVVVDVSTVDAASHIDELAAWLNTNQPISMAVTGKTKEQSLEVGLALWEKTGLVVNTIGSPENPALTCQARPQEAEVFGEFPPRQVISEYTKYPVVVPSATPGYDSSYNIESFLNKQATVGSNVGTPFLQEISNISVRGYCVTLMEYLLDACKENPKRGFGTSRTALWGLQRPPLNTTTYLQCNTSSWDDLAPHLFLFYATNAKTQVVVLPGGSDVIQSKCEKLGIAVKSEGDPVLAPGDNLKMIDGPLESYPMVGQFITTLFPIGHIKSTESNDEEFVARAKVLQKWLKVEVSG